MKYKVGDKFKCILDDPDHFTKGRVYSIKREARGLFLVRCDSDVNHSGPDPEYASHPFIYNDKVNTSRDCYKWWQIHFIKVTPEINKNTKIL